MTEIKEFKTWLDGHIVKFEIHGQEFRLDTSKSDEIIDPIRYAEWWKGKLQTSLLRLRNFPSLTKKESIPMVSTLIEDLHISVRLWNVLQRYLEYTYKISYRDLGILNLTDLYKIFPYTDMGIRNYGVKTRAEIEKIFREAGFPMNKPPLK